MKANGAYGTALRLSEREERFALAIVEGRSQTAAYVAAGYAAAGARGNASRLIARDSIADRVAELRAPAVAAVKLTLEAHLDELAHLRDAARDAGAFGVAVAAEVARGKAAGLYDRREAAAAQGPEPYSEWWKRMCRPHGKEHDRLAYRAEGAQMEPA